jgi:glycosyltransferase involved in cell wall biosynthesis
MLVSVIIPCCGAGDYIDETVSSVLRQTHPDLELILVDDGSAGEMGEILRRASERRPSRVRLIPGPRRGGGAARNLGAAEARGEYLQYLDPFDTLCPKKISHQVARIRRCPVAPDLVAADFYRLRHDGRRERCRIGSEDPWLDLLVAEFGCASSNLFRAESLRSAGGWKEAGRDDCEYDLMFRMLRAGGRPLLDNRPLTVIRERRESRRRPGESTNRCVGFVDLRLRMIEHLKSRGMLSWERLEAVRGTIERALGRGATSPRNSETLAG